MVKRNIGAGSDLHIGAEQFTVEARVPLPANRFARLDPGLDAFDDASTGIQVEAIEDTTGFDDTRQEAKTDEIGVKKCPKKPEIFIPNAFSPNKDGLNDYFGPKGQFESITSFNMYIFDRWGQIVFYTNDLNKMWDGTFHGAIKQDTYAYKIVVQDVFNDVFEFIGTVILLP